MKDVIVLSRAEAEIFERYAHLFSKSQKKGEKFDAAVNNAFSMLAKQPAIASRWRSSPLRCYRLTRWSFGLFYKIEGSRVMIMAALDLRQSDDSIERRLGLT